MGKSEKRVKPDRINSLKKRYDALLEEDKKRKQRNEYIIGSLDKIRSCSSLVPIRHRHADVDSTAALNNLRQTSEKDSSRYDVQTSRSYPTPVPISTKYTDESMLVSQLSKKFILIPKLNSSITLVNNFQSVNDNVVDNHDWRNKYKILDLLKHDKKEQFQTPEKEQQLHKEKDLIPNSNPLNDLNLLQKYDLPVRETYTPSSKQEYSKTTGLNNDKKEKLATKSPESFTVLNNNTRIGLKRQDYIPTSPLTYDYKYKVDDGKEKTNQSEDNYRYGPHGPQTEPFTYEYSYKDIKEDNIPTNESIEQSYQNPSSNAKIPTEKDLSKSFNEGYKDSSGDSQSKPDVEMKKLAQVSETNPSYVHTKQLEQTDIIHQNLNLSIVESNTPVYPDTNFQTKQMHPENTQITPSPNKQIISQQAEKIKQSNDSAINPPETTDKNKVVYNSTEPDYKVNDFNHPPNTYPQPLTTHDSENDDKHFESNELELEYPIQQESDQNLQEYDENQLHGSQTVTEEQYNLVQQELEQINHDDDLTNQRYELDDKESSQTQNEYNPNQVHYDPNQQGYEPIQQYDVDQVGFETEATISDPNQKEYAPTDQAYDLDQQALNTNQLGSEHDQLQYAVDDSQQFTTGDQIQNAKDDRPEYAVGDQQHYEITDQQQYTIGDQQQKPTGDQLQYEMADQQQYAIGDQQYEMHNQQQYLTGDQQQYALGDQHQYVVGDEQQYAVGNQHYVEGEQPYAVGDEQQYAVGHEQQYAVGIEQPYAVGDEQPYAVGDEQQYVVDHEQPYAVGDQQQYVEGDQQQYVVGDSQVNAMGDQQYEMQQNNLDDDSNVTQELTTIQQYELNGKNNPSVPITQKEPQMQVQQNNNKISDQKVLKEKKEADNKIAVTKKSKNKEPSVEQAKVARKLRA